MAPARGQSIKKTDGMVAMDVSRPAFAPTPSASRGRSLKR